MTPKEIAESIIETETDDLCDIKRARAYLQLEAEIERLREALQFYADASYERTVEDDLGYKYNPEEWIYNEPEILEDGGQRAREALEGKF